MKELWAVDRISQGIAVLEGPKRELRRVPLEELPKGIKEGDCLCKEENFFSPDEGETLRRKAENKALFERLKNKAGEE